MDIQLILKEIEKKQHIPILPIFVLPSKQAEASSVLI